MKRSLIKKLSKLFLVIFVFVFIGIAQAKCLMDIGKVGVSLQSYAYEAENQGLNLDIPTDNAYSVDGQWIIFCSDLGLEFDFGIDYSKLKFLDLGMDKSESVNILSMNVRATRAFKKYKKLSIILDFGLIDEFDFLRVGEEHSERTFMNRAFGVGFSYDLYATKDYSLNSRFIFGLLFPEDESGYDTSTYNSIELSLLYKLFIMKSIEITGEYKRSKHVLDDEFFQKKYEGTSTSLSLVSSLLFRF